MEAKKLYQVCQLECARNMTPAMAIHLELLLCLQCFFYVKKAFFPSNCWFSGFMFLTMMAGSTFVRRAECLQPQLWGYSVITPLLFAGGK